MTAKRIHTKHAQQGETGFDTTFHENWPKVYGLLFRLVGDPAEAEDLALECFLRLHQNMRHLSGESETGAWLYRVATNLGLNALRGRARRLHYETEAGRLALERAAPPDPAGEVERREDRALVRTILGRMKPRSARLLILRHAGLSYAEVAAAVGVAPGSVGTLLVRAEREFETIYSELER